MLAGESGQSDAQAGHCATHSQQRLRVPSGAARHWHAPLQEHHPGPGAARGPDRAQDGPAAGHDQLDISLRADHAGHRDHRAGRLQVQSGEHHGPALDQDRDALLPLRGAQSQSVHDAAAAARALPPQQAAGQLL